MSPRTRDKSMALTTTMHKQWTETQDGERYWEGGGEEGRREIADSARFTRLNKAMRLVKAKVAPPLWNNGGASGR